MHVSSACPLRVASLVWQPRPGAFALTVVCKATFLLRPGTSPLAPVQEAPWTADIPWNDAPRGSLWAASDLAPFKRRVDVLLSGHAHAPPGERVTSLVTRLSVGTVDKQIEVHGERAWSSDGRITPATPFTRMPLRWERAAGGPGTWNPVGVAAEGPLDASGFRLAPNLLPPGAALRGPAALLPPVGYGPIAPSWPERALKLRQHVATFRHDAWAERPLPEDIDTGYFNVAPPDQQLDQLVAGEWLLLEHLHPQHAQLMTVLERVTPRAVLHRHHDEPRPLRLRCDTLWIDADRGTCALSWRGAVPLEQPAEVGTVVVSVARPGDEEEDVADARRTSRPAPANADIAPSRFASTAPASAANGGGAVAADVAATLAPRLDATHPDSVPFFERRQALPFEPLPTAPEPVARPSAPVFPPVARPPPFLGPPASAAPAETAEVGAIAPPPSGAALPAGELPPRPPAPSAPAAPAAPSPAESRPEARPPLSAPPEPPGPPVRAEEIPLERLASIAAELAEQRTPRAEVLRAHQLSEREWAAAEHHLRAALEKDARAGGKLRAAHDGAYVAAVERLRGPITLPEYARIAVGLERGEASEVLEALKIQQAALLPIVRVWTKKTASDPKQVAKLMALLEELRAG
jgi:hypothetical protein